MSDNSGIKNDRKQIMEYYGINLQLFKMIEELTEATTEVIKVLSGKPDACIKSLVEELADVALLSDQIIDYYGAGCAFSETYLYKLRRTLKRISEEKERDKHE